MNRYKVICLILVGSGLLAAGYGIHDLSREHRKGRVPRPPKRAGVPAVFYQVEYHNLVAPVEIRNATIEKFVRAWKNNEKFAVYDTGSGLDCIMSFYWVTENGKIFLLLTDDEHMLWNKTVVYRSISQPILFYQDNDTERFVTVGPEIFEDREIVMTHELNLGSPRAKGNTTPASGQDTESSDKGDGK